MRFATVSRDKHTESCEKVHPAKSNCASRYSGAQSKISKCTFRCSGVREKCMKFAFRYSFARSTRRILREGSSSKFKMCVWLQRRAIKNFQMYVSLQRRAQKCMKQGTDAHRSAPDTKIIVLPQFRRSDQHEVRKGLAGTQNNLHFTAVLSIRRSLFALKVARRRVKFAFHQRFERLRFTVCIKGCSGT